MLTMSKQEKRIQQLLKDPTQLRYPELISLFTGLGFGVKELSGSHKLIYRKDNSLFATTIAVHNNDCLPIYKINMKKLYLSLFH